MFIIVGLGNPGNKYTRTRHNVGFRVIERLSQIYNIPLVEKELFVIGKGALEGTESVLLKPLTYMNRSGIAVKKVLNKFYIPQDELAVKLLVIHDDLDLDTGKIKIRKNGSSGGHKGIEAIIQETGTKNFMRIKIGIGRERDVPVEQYVLSNFRPHEKNLIEDAIINACDAVAVITTKGIEKAMNTFNRAAKSDAEQAPENR